jgi:hypothetical protein
MLGQNGIQCKKYITVTIAALDFESANTKFIGYEAHLTACLKKLETELIPIKANERIRILAYIFRDVNTEISAVSRVEFARSAEKQLCCPDYFEFKKDYFMYGSKYARCVYFMRFPESVTDTIFMDLIETNQSMIITKNLEFVPPETATKLVRGQITNMQMEQTAKTRKAAQQGMFVDPVAGTTLAEDMQDAQEFMQNITRDNLLHFRYA